MGAAQARLLTELCTSASVLPLVPMYRLPISTAAPGQLAPREALEQPVELAEPEALAEREGPAIQAIREELDQRVGLAGLAGLVEREAGPATIFCTQTVATRVDSIPEARRTLWVSVSCPLQAHTGVPSHPASS